MQYKPQQNSTNSVYCDMERAKHKIEKKPLKTGASFPQDLQGLERSSRAIDTMLETFHVKSEKEQRRVKNKIKQEETVGEKKITLNRKHRDIQMKELTTQQRLVKTRYMNMVKRTKANEISMKQRKK